MTHRVGGVIVLPAELLVAEDVLGERFAGRLGSTTFELAYQRLPTTAREDGVDSLEPPYVVEDYVTNAVGPPRDRTRQSLNRAIASDASAFAPPQSLPSRT